MKYGAVLAAIAGVAAALPGSRRATRPSRSSSVNHKDDRFPQFSSNWAGAVQIGTGITRVQGTVTVPHLSGGDANTAASAWVGIDGDTCQTAILQTGVSFFADGSLDAWYEWIPNGAVSFTNFQFAAGDQIRMTVDASSRRAGVATLENLTGGGSVSHTFTRTPSSLCETNAEWIVEDFESNGQLVPFANFGTVTFTNASATSSAGTITPSGATIIDIRQGSSVLTNCAVSGNDLTCSYAGN
ncbi:Aspergillopepsin-2 [Tolypocladium capitatum]|uniref:Aspergillopepsin-2 n=1 Tax=Tolypocladium capitatum TaxID=45235 RepID=A0A2K3Q8I0_9HYPO|nr:Aspergillopepsin-2 [Tolypocladium capitatum]